MGFAVPSVSQRPAPPRTGMQGQFCRVVPPDIEQHAADLYIANTEDTEGQMWPYLTFFADPLSSD